MLLHNALKRERRKDGAKGENNKSKEEEGGM
jgi:hypothetical protein